MGVASTCAGTPKTTGVGVGTGGGVTGGGGPWDGGAPCNGAKIARAITAKTIAVANTSAAGRRFLRIAVPDICAWDGFRANRYSPRRWADLARYAPALMNSDTRSLIMMVVALVLARITSGMTEASATRRPAMPWT